MKKYITIAALLAAGTAFANAESATWDFTKNGFYIGEELFELDATKEFSIAFTFAPTATVNADLFTLSDKSTGDLIKFGTNGSYSGNTAKYTVGNWTTSSGGHYTLTRMNSTAQNNVIKFTFSNLTDTGTRNLNVNIAFSQTTNGATENDNYSNKIFNFSDAIAWDTLDLASNVDMKSVVLEGSAAPAVPEPSAFGLLAGIGALALVASRRRRK